jgi:hypothetical protein
MGLRAMPRLCLWKFTEASWFTVVSSQFMFQGSVKDSFVFGKKFPYPLLNLIHGILASNFINP